MIQFLSERPYFTIVQKYAGDICLEDSELGFSAVFISIQDIFVGVTGTDGKAFSSIYVSFCV